MDHTVKDENIKSIRFSVDTDEKLTKLALKRGMSKQQFVVSMVDYFYKTKKDPKDLNDELLKNAINRKTDNIIAFIRTQENDLLIPTRKDTELVLRSLQQMVTFLNEYLIGHNQTQAGIIKEHSEYLAEIFRLVKKLGEAEQDKATLKAKFLKLLEFYIEHREQMNMMTSKAEKDALVAHVQEQVRNL